jgi:hypothetical protein
MGSDFTRRCGASGFFGLVHHEIPRHISRKGQPDLRHQGRVYNLLSHPPARHIPAVPQSAQLLSLYTAILLSQEKNLS